LLNVGYLAAKVKMQQNKRVAGFRVFQSFDEFDEFRQRYAELRTVSAGVRPFAGTAGSEPDAHAELRLAVGLRRERHQLLELAEFLHDRHDVLAESLCRDDQRKHRAILDPVADQERFVGDKVRQRCDELRFRAALEAETVWFAGIEYFFDDFVKLVDLDRVHAAVNVLVYGVLDRLSKCFVQSSHACTQYILEAQQQRELDVAAPCIGHDIHDVDSSRQLPSVAAMASSSVPSAASSTGPAFCGRGSDPVRLA
jgi:hypothetical protein